MNRHALAARVASCAAIVGLGSAVGLAGSVICAFALDDPRVSLCAFAFLTLTIMNMVFAVIAQAIASHSKSTAHGFDVILRSGAPPSS